MYISFFILRVTAPIQLIINIYRFIIGLLGSIIVYYLLSTICKIQHKRIKSIISFIGRESLGVYILSTPFICNILNYLTIDLAQIDYI